MSDYERGHTDAITEYRLRDDNLAAAVHAWFCGASVKHGDKGRPHIGWACERGAAAIRSELDRLADDSPWNREPCPECGGYLGRHSVACAAPQSIIEEVGR